MSRKLKFPVFDADNHMYEKTDAFTRYLPDEAQGLIKFVELDGRTKIAIKNTISEYIPNPRSTRSRRRVHRSCSSGSRTRPRRPSPRISSPRLRRSTSNLPTRSSNPSRG